jgi:hypothetical protein
MNAPSKNKFGKLWVFGGVANNAQHLDVCRISSKAGFSAVRFDVVTLQIFFASTFFTLAAFVYDLGYDFAGVVFSFAGAAVPFMMCFATKLFASSGSRARNGTVLACATSTFSYLKVLTALFARAIQHSFGLVRSKFLRAFSRTCVSFPANMCVWSAKKVAANRTCKYSTSATFNFSLEFSHG